MIHDENRIMILNEAGIMKLMDDRMKIRIETSINHKQSEVE